MTSIRHRIISFMARLAPNWAKSTFRFLRFKFFRAIVGQQIAIELSGLSFRIYFDNFTVYRACKNFTSFEPEFLQEFMTEAPEAKVIYDIGANIGLYSILAAILNPETKVFAFEPEEHNFSALVRNIELNNLNNCHPIQIALGDTDGPIGFTFQDGGPGVGGHRVSYGNSADSTNMQMAVSTVDKLVNQRRVPPPDLIKIDVEGYEFHVLRGMTGILTDVKPVILLELHEGFLINYGESAGELNKFMSAHEYASRVLRANGIGKKTRHSQKHIAYRAAPGESRTL